MALSFQLFQHTAGMAAIAQSGVQSHLPRLDLQKVQNLIHHDGNMHTRRGLAALDDLIHIGLILLRLQFLVFLLIVTGMGSLITYPPLMFLLHGVTLPISDDFSPV